MTFTTEKSENFTVKLLNNLGIADFFFTVWNSV